MGELPEPWNTAAERAGIRQTYRGIGEAAGLSHVTVRRLIAEGRTSPATVTRVATALGVDEAEVYRWADIELSEWGPWTPPKEAHKLNPRARAALEELIRAVTQGGTSDGRQPEAEKNDDGPAGVGDTATSAEPTAAEQAEYAQERQKALNYLQQVHEASARSDHIARQILRAEYLNQDPAVVLIVDQYAWRTHQDLYQKAGGRGSDTDATLVMLTKLFDLVEAQRQLAEAEALPSAKRAARSSSGRSRSRAVDPMDTAGEENQDTGPT